MALFCCGALCMCIHFRVCALFQKICTLPNLHPNRHCTHSHTYKKSPFLGYLLFAWMILLIPFFISNGVLTGLHFYEYDLINTSKVDITEAIVRYNNQFNLGIRIWSVPVEDFFYGLAMVLLTVTPYEHFRLKWKSKTSL